MNTVRSKVCNRLDSEMFLPFGISVEQLKRAHSLSANFNDLGFPWGTDIGVEGTVMKKRVEEFVLVGDLKITC